MLPVYFLEKENFWTSGMMILSAVSFSFFSMYLILVNKSFLIEWELMSLVGVNLIFSFYMDFMSVVFFLFVALISGCVFLYSGSYMVDDKNFRLFLILVLLFVLSMFFMVFSLNMISMMLGWDGLGVVSYILVIYYKNEKSNSAGMITALSNRIGDAALLLSIACFLELGSWNYMLMDCVNSNFLLFLICLAAITKSAQIPFSAWLPAAMAAPTPVSALVHSSTLVTAGVYMLIRFSVLLKGSLVMEMFIYLGMMTTLMASISALFEVDFKKVVALSTLSQLGIMITTLSLGFEELAFMHLLIHAIFKALLFMCSGKVIHSVGGGQDVRKMGGMFFNLPVTGMVMVLSSFALCGIPFLSGFYSKDIIFESAEMSDSFLVDYIMYMMVVGLSSSYSFRLMFLSVVSFNNQNSSFMGDEEDWTMLSSKLLLVIMSLVSGALLVWVMMFTPNFISLVFYLKWLAFISMLLGFSLGVGLCFSNYKNSFFINNLSKLEVSMVMWNLPLLSGMFWSSFVYKLSTGFKSLDFGWSEVFGGQGLNFLVFSKSRSFISWPLNNVKSTLVVFVFGVMFSCLGL